MARHRAPSASTVYDKVDRVPPRTATVSGRAAKRR